MISVDLRSNVLGALPVSDSIFNIVLAANTAKTVARNQIPAGATHCLVGCNVTGLFVKANGTAAVPAADVLDGTGQMVDPVLIDLRANAGSLSFINAAAAVVSLSFFKVA